MLDVVGALRTVRDTLTAAGVKAAVNAGQVRTPGVWVTAEGIELDRLAVDAGTVHARLVLIVPASDDERAWEALTALAADVTDALAAAELFTGGDIDVENVALPDNPTQPLPAWALSLDLDVTP